MTRQFFFALTVAGLCLINGNSFADQTQPSNDTLSQMGLAGMQIASETEAMQVRGKGYVHGGHGSSVAAWGQSSANIGGPHGGASASNGYEAKGKHEAGGETSSVAGMSIEKTVSRKGCGCKSTYKLSLTKTYFSGGSSSAYAK